MIPDSSNLIDTVPQNIAHWTRVNAEHTDARATRSWAREEITWGNWGVAESEMHALPDVSGLDVVELGCGTAYFSAWLAKHSARSVGVDPTPAQLATARRAQRETDWIRLLRQNGFEVEDLIEIRAPQTASQHAYYDFVSPVWAREWASEEIWKARKG